MVALSALMAILFQTLCIRLGVCTGLDLAESCRLACDQKPVEDSMKAAWGRWLLRWWLYLMAEGAIAATDLAEIIGSAIALQLLFGWPLVAGVLVTALDTLVLLYCWQPSKSGGTPPEDEEATLQEGQVIVQTASSKKSALMRSATTPQALTHTLETIILCLILTVGICFLILLFQLKTDWSLVFRGYLPTVKLITDPSMLYVGMGILGATVMPHNLYLQSAICKYRRVDVRRHDDLGDDDEIRESGGRNDSEAGETFAMGSLQSSRNNAEGVCSGEGSSSLITQEGRALPSQMSVADDQPLLPTSPQGSPQSEDTSTPDGSVTPKKDPHRLRSLLLTVRYATVDTLIALFFAMLVNSLILIVSASAFWLPYTQHSNTNSTLPSINGTQTNTTLSPPAPKVVGELQDAHRALQEQLNPTAGVLFALALLAAGQSSTLTGTLAGQYVMQGFLHLHVHPLLRRLLTRLVALVPAVTVAWVSGDVGVTGLLVGSQVVLGVLVPFAVVPLVYFTCTEAGARLVLGMDRAQSGEMAEDGNQNQHETTEALYSMYQLSWVWRYLSWASCVLLCLMNGYLVVSVLMGVE